MPLHFLFHKWYQAEELSSVTCDIWSHYGEYYDIIVTQNIQVNNIQMKYISFQFHVNEWRVNDLQHVMLLCSEESISVTFLYLIEDCHALNVNVFMKIPFSLREIFSFLLIWFVLKINELVILVRRETFAENEKYNFIIFDIWMNPDYDTSFINSFPLFQKCLGKET